MTRLRWDDPSPVFLDWETQSACELREVGGRLYAEHPTTRVLSLVVNDGPDWHVWLPTLWKDPELTTLEIAEIERYGVDPARVWLYPGREFPGALRNVCRGRTVVAHNGLAFDRFVWDRFVGEPVAWCDTLYLARLAGLPGGLDSLARYELRTGKDAAAGIVKQFFKADYAPEGYKPPRRGNKFALEFAEVEGAGRVMYRVPLPGQVGVLLRYNLADVVLMGELYRGVLDSVEVEADVIAAHLACNDRGVQADARLLDAITAVSEESRARAVDVIAELTNGELARDAKGKPDINSGPKMHAWLASKGVRLVARGVDGVAKASLRKDTIEQALADPRLMLDEDAPFAAVESIDPIVFDVLRIRANALRITGAKSARATACLGPDGRFRDGHTYHQAHTGRDSSNRVQFQNIPRPKKGVDINAIVEAFERGEWGSDARADYSYLKGTLGDGKLTVDDALSGLLRPGFLARRGCLLGIVDYATVECRGLAWIADEQTLLDAFAAGVDVYKITAGRIYGKPPADVTDDERQVGKVVTLGCGYGLGVEKFRLYAAANGIDLVRAGVTAEQCIDAFRSAYPMIAGGYAGQINGRPYRRGGIWDKLDRAAMDAVRFGADVEAGRCVFSHGADRVLRVRLPSGRALHYRNARIEDRVPGYCAALGLPPKAKATLCYDNPRGYTGTMYGGKWAENVVQALCREPLMSAMVELDRRGYEVVLRVHDELVAELPEREAAFRLREMCEVMSTPPAWADGFPLGVSGFIASRYVKKPPPGAVEIDARLGRITECKLIEK